MTPIDRFLLPLRLARARVRGALRTERELGTPFVVEEFDPGFPEGEAAYNAMGEAADGRVWFAIGTKSLGAGARLFVFDPATSSLRMVADLDEALAPPAGVRAIPHGKVHVDLVPHGSAMVGATHVGYYDPQSTIERPAVVPGYTPYPGGWFFRIENDRVAPLAQAPPGEGIITMSADLVRERLIALTWPSGFLLTLDLESRALGNDGPMFGAGENGSKKDGTWSRICRSIGIDPRDGAAYWSDDRGLISRFDGRSIEVVATTPQKTIWRKVFWHPAEEVFYGWLWRSSTLFRFDPKTLTCEEIGSLAVHDAPATLAFAWSPSTNAIHALVSGPAVLRRKRGRLASSVFHLSLDLGGGTTRVSGPLRLADGRWLTQSQSLLLRDDRAYCLCWVEGRREEEEVTFARLDLTRMTASETRLVRL